MDKVEEFLDKFTRKIDICIYETRLTDTTLKSATIPSYQMYCYNSNSKAGVMIFIGGKNLALPMLCNIISPVGLLLFTSKSIYPNQKI